MLHMACIMLYRGCIVLHRAYIMLHRGCIMLHRGCRMLHKGAGWLLADWLATGGWLAGYRDPSTSPLEGRMMILGPTVI